MAEDLPITAESPDVFRLTADLVDIASESFQELRLVEFLESELRSLDHLEVTRVGDNLVARTLFGRPTRVVLGGHTDTVPANGNFPARIEGDTIWGVGSADMKGGLAVMLTSARVHTAPTVDLTYVFYAREEVASVHNGLGEPTDGGIEAGCQGSIRAKVTLRGERAHTARAWMGVNAVHRAAPLLAHLAGYTPRQPVIDGCRFHEALLAVGIDGGVSGNVVPDLVTVTVAHRFAPDRTASQAEEHLAEELGPFLGPDDTFEVVDVAHAAAPATGHPLLASMIERHGLAVSAKLGWTDVARFAERGVPAVNFGPGDPTIAHTAGEHVARESIERTWAAIDGLARS